MSLSICPACGNRVSLSASRCPKCRVQFMVPEARVVQPPPPPVPRMVACPSCGLPISTAVRMCPHCGDSLVNIESAIPEPPVVERIRTAIRIVEDDPPPPAKRLSKTGQRVALASILPGIAGFLFGAINGMVASQYWPLFGGFMVMVAEPMSPGRLSVLPAHAIVCGLAGMVVFGLIGAFIRYATMD